MGVLDKFLIRSPRGKQASRSRFNPGRDQSWDWNELIKTIEANFEGDFDLVALQAQADASTAANTTNADGIASNDSDIAGNTSSIAESTAAIAATNEALATLTTAFDEVTAQVTENKVTIASLVSHIDVLCACLAAADIECEECGR